MRFSQNFLIDEGVAERQISYADLKENDVVLEIGAGNGILTRRIAKIAKVIAIEIDERFIPKLKNIKNVELINTDVTKLDLKDIYFNKVISNIPYHISSEITFKLLEKRFDLGILMYQKEFAERLVAKKGKNYSRLSVMVYSKANVEILEIVSRKAFRPIPKVDSCIVKILPIGKRFSVDDKIFEEVVKVLFAHRRKKIKNSLSISGLLPREEAEKIDAAELRVDEISPEKIAEICKIVERKNEMEKNI